MRDANCDIRACGSTPDPIISVVNLIAVIVSPERATMSKSSSFSRGVRCTRRDKSINLSMHQRLKRSKKKGSSHMHPQYVEPLMY